MVPPRMWVQTSVRASTRRAPRGRGSPAVLRASAIAVLASQIAAICSAGAITRSPAIPSSSPHLVINRSFAAAACRSAAPSGSRAMTRRAARRRSCSGVVLLPGLVTSGSTSFSTWAATSAVVVPVALATAMAWSTSIRPCCRACRVPGNRVANARAVEIALPAAASLLRTANAISVGSISASPG